MLGSNQRKMTHEFRRKFCFFPFFKLDKIISIFLDGQIYIFLLNADINITFFIDLIVDAMAKW